jgi:hypothetical protein
MKCDQQLVGPIGLADNESEKLGAVIGTVWDVPHALGADALEREPWDGRRLKDDALLVQPEQGDDEHVDRGGDQHDEQEHFTKC